MVQSQHWINYQKLKFKINVGFLLYLVVAQSTQGNDENNAGRECQN
jgi:hypothetical protein